jgi:hypothetical protein
MPLQGEAINNIQEHEWRFLRVEAQKMFDQALKDDFILQNVLQTVGTDGMHDWFPTIGAIPLPEYTPKGHDVPFSDITAYLIETDLKYFSRGTYVDRQTLKATRLMDGIMNQLPQKLAQAAQVWIHAGFYEFIMDSPGNLKCLPNPYNMTTYDGRTLFHTHADHIALTGGNVESGINLSALTPKQLRAKFVEVIQKLRRAKFPDTNIPYWTGCSFEDMDITILYPNTLWELFQEAFNTDRWPAVAYDSTGAAQGAAAIENIIKSVRPKLYDDAFIDIIDTSGDTMFVFLNTKKHPSQKAVGLALNSKGFNGDGGVYTKFGSEFNVKVGTTNEKSAYITIENLGPGSVPWVVQNKWASTVKGYGGFIAFNPFRCFKVYNT